MRFFYAVLFLFVALLATFSPNLRGMGSESSGTAASLFGFRDATEETKLESRFLAVPDPKLARNICAS